MINLHESMGPDRYQTRDPWICSQTRICCQTRYRLRYAARLARLRMTLLGQGKALSCPEPSYKTFDGSTVSSIRLNIEMFK